MRALTLRAQARGLSTASKFSPGYCIQKSFPNSRLVTLRLGALRSMTFPRLKTRCHVLAAVSHYNLRLRRYNSVCGVRWEAQRHTAFPSRALTDHLALNALEMT